MTNANHAQTPTARLSASFASLDYLPSACIEEITKIVEQYVAESWEDKMKCLIDKRITECHSGIAHVTRIDTSVDPDGYKNRVIGYGEDFTVNQPVVTTVENLLQTAIRVNTDSACKKHFEAAHDAMVANNFIEAFNLLAPVINYGIRPNSISRSPETVIAQAAYMLLVIGMNVNNPQSAEDAGVCH
jgi:hypothetical protein